MSITVCFRYLFSMSITVCFRFSLPSNLTAKKSMKMKFSAKKIYIQIFSGVTKDYKYVKSPKMREHFNMNVGFKVLPGSQT